VICSIKSLIAILILRINSITSLPNSIAGLEVGRIFQFGPWSQIYVIGPSIDQQTFNFFNLALDSINSKPSIYTPFPVWSVVLDFFN
jgi:hypothetical protein